MNDGISFESKVERWLRRNRGASFTERRARIRGKVAGHAHEVDVHAIVVNDLYKLVAIVAVTSLCVAVAGVAIEEPLVAGIAAIAGLFFGVLTFVLLNDPSHIWVECKSGVDTVRRDVVWKLASQFEDVRALGGALDGWYPTEAWLVVRSQFDVDALRFAREHGIRCFVEQSGDIREVV